MVHPIQAPTNVAWLSSDLKEATAATCVYVYCTWKLSLVAYAQSLRIPAYESARADHSTVSSLPQDPGWVRSERFASPGGSQRTAHGQGRGNRHGPTRKLAHF